MRLLRLRLVVIMLDELYFHAEVLQGLALLSVEIFDQDLV